MKDERPGPDPGACPVCGGRFQVARRAWLSRCVGCGFRISTLRPDIEDLAAKSAALDETARARGLAELRRANFATILDRAVSLGLPRGAEILDVGCAHGWFLEAASARGFRVEGIEPDPEMAAIAASAGLAVTRGFFPRDLRPGRRYDAIAFNDTFEHIPDPAAVVAACAAHLKPDGWLFINLPSADGAFFRTALLLDRCGLAGPLARMWQKGLSSPHLSYFAPDQLVRLVAARGFRLCDAADLETLRLSGLRQRIGYAQGGTALSRGIVLLGALIAYPVLRLLPADIKLMIFRRSPA